VVAGLEKDAFVPSETINLNLDIDNLKCEQKITRIKGKMYRHIRAVSSNGNFYDEKCCILKRKITDEIKAHSKAKCLLAFPLDKIDKKDKYLENLIKEKPHLQVEYKHWLFQP
jgi:hypothetical protein